MARKNWKLMLLLLVASDLAVVAGAWAGAYGVRFGLVPHEVHPAFHDLVANTLIVLVVSVFVLWGAGLYKSRRDKSFLLELGQILKASTFIWGLLVVIIYFTAGTPLTRGMLLAFWPLLAAGLVLERGLFRALLRALRRRGWNLRYALIVGTGRLGQSVLLRLQRHAWTGIRITGFIAEPAEPGTRPPRAAIRGIPVLGTTDHLADLVRQAGADCVFVALPTRSGERLHAVIRDLEKSRTDVRIVPDLFLSRFPGSAGLSELDGMPIVTLYELPLTGWPQLYKRAFDLAGALFGLLLLAVPLACIALAVKLQDGGPVLYRQRRVSYGRRAFWILKFRTMVVGAESQGPTFASRNDPRCTRLGRWLRSMSLDELPQLFNVLVGDMSLVGPRPERPEMLERIEKEVPGFPLRTLARAGLTGWAQIHGYRGGGTRAGLRKRLQYDLYYLNHWSPLLDLRIVLATIVRGFRHRNAY